MTKQQARATLLALHRAHQRSRDLPADQVDACRELCDHIRRALAIADKEVADVAMEICYHLHQIDISKRK